jgi:hypothetical protein
MLKGVGVQDQFPMFKEEEENIECLHYCVPKHRHRKICRKIKQT